MVEIKDFAMPSKCKKCIFEKYDWEYGEHSCLINSILTEEERETSRVKSCPLVEN